MWKALEKRSLASLGSGSALAMQCAMTRRFRFPPFSSSDKEHAPTEALREGTCSQSRSTQSNTIGEAFRSTGHARGGGRGR